MDEERDAAIKRIEEKHGLYKRVFDSEDGKVLLADLERDCYLKSSLFSKDAMEMAFREGMRSIILHINSMRTLDIDDFKKLNDENNK